MWYIDVMWLIFLFGAAFTLTVLLPRALCGGKRPDEPNDFVGDYDGGWLLIGGAGAILLTSALLTGMGLFTPVVSKIVTSRETLNLVDVRTCQYGDVMLITSSAGRSVEYVAVRPRNIILEKKEISQLVAEVTTQTVTLPIWWPSFLQTEEPRVRVYLSGPAEKIQPLISML
jgi:hypothetical protein